MTREHSRLRVFLLFSILFVGLAATAAPLIPRVHAAGTVYISPESQAQQSTGTTITYDVKVANMDPFDTWEIYVKTNNSVLDANPRSDSSPTSISVTGNVMTANYSVQMFTIVNCVDGLGTGCSGYDAPGIVHSAVSGDTEGKGVKGPINGLLFTITYTVMGGTYTFLDFQGSASPVVILEAGVKLTYDALGGVYGNPPPLPKADFTWSPFFPIADSPATFTVVNASDPTGAKISSYSWTFVYPNARPATVSVPSYNFTFGSAALNVGAANVTVLLTVEDVNGLVSRPIAHTVTVYKTATILLLIEISSPTARDSVVAGTLFNVTVTVTNSGNVPLGGFNLTYYLDNIAVKTTIFRGVLDNSLHRQAGFFYLLDTTGLKPDTYEVTVSIPPLPGSMNAANQTASLVIRIIYPYQGALIPFTIPETVGLIIVGLVALGLVRFSLARARRRRRILADELG